MFDGLYIMDLNSELARLWPQDPALVADLEYLASYGMLENAPSTARQIAYNISITLRHEVEAVFGDFSLEDFAIIGDGSREDLLLQAELFSSSVGHPSTAHRLDGRLPRGGELLVAFFATLSGQRTVGALERPLYRREWTALSSAVQLPKSMRGIDHERQVVEVALKSLPTPAEDTPLEDLLDFVRDSETRDQVDGLRLWMRNIAQQNLLAADVELELASLLHDFRRHMKAAYIKSHQSTLRTLVSVPLGAAEELLHLRPEIPLEVWRHR